MAEKVQIVIEAVDKATAPLTKVSKSMGGLNTGAVNLAAGMSIVSQGMNIANQVFQTAKRVVDETVGAYISYANAMQDGSRLTGIAIDQYSRLVQVGDDVRLSQEQMKTAFTIASRQGIDVSIDGLQKLSERYNALTDPTEKAQLLLKTFGRSGADMGRLMELGAAGIAQATAAVDKNLIVTKESAARAEELRLAQDALSDAWTGAKNVIAQALIPGLTKLAGGLFKVITYTQDLKTEFEQTSDKLEDSSVTWKEYALGLVKAGQETGQFHEMSARMADALIDGKLSGEAYDKALKQLVIEIGGLSEASFSAKDDLNGLNQMADEGVVYFGDLSGSIKKLAEQEMEAAAQAAIDLSDSLKGQLDLTLKLTDLTGGYTDKMAELTQKYKDAEATLANLELNYPADEAGIAAAKQDLIDIQGEMTKTGDAYDAATKRIVWDMMVAKLAIDGYTQAEFNWAMQAGVDMGIITQESADLAVALMADADKEIAAFEAAAAKADALGLAIERIPTSKEITITTYFHNVGSQGSGTGYVPEEIPQFYAKGTDFIVPPGYPNDSFGPIYVESGERVVVVPKSEQVDKRTFNFNYSGNASAQSVQQAYEMARLLQ